VYIPWAVIARTSSPTPHFDFFTNVFKQKREYHHYLPYLKNIFCRPAFRTHKDFVSILNYSQHSLGEKIFLCAQAVFELSIFLPLPT
jgi:hypothetical protein